ncbi:hypothetical protein L207DRAFT_515411, partial [Hyaloscypha variabilis F]
RIIGKGAYKSRRVRQAAHNRNREFITLLAYISTIRKKIPASLLYTSESLKWLIDVFELVTRPTSPYTKRLLIVDSYSSHPLNVILFGLLLLAYYKELNAFNIRGLSIVPMKKKNFLKLFRPAWRISFTKENILKAFTKPGIWPYDPALVLNVITPDYRKNPTRAKLEKLFKANEELATQATLDQWTTIGLIEALKDEKKSRARGKRLNILGEEHTGPILFSVENVQRAQERFTKKEAFEKLERIRIDTKKAEIAAKKQKAKVENAEKALQAVKEAAQTKALKALLVRIKAPIKARKALVIKKKVVRFISSNIKGQGMETPAK